MQASKVLLFFLVSIVDLGSPLLSPSGDLLPIPLPEVVSFYLFTLQNPRVPQELRINDAASVLKSNFNASNPTRFTIHGWLSNAKHDLNTRLRDAYLSRGPNNIIAVSWEEESTNLYQLSVRHIPGVALKIAEFIDWMTNNGWINLGKLTLLGHSLGSHIAGIAARSVKSGQVHTIIGMDPPQSGFNYNTSAIRLRSTDAYYVETIQTTAGTQGYLEPVGKASFYPNGGVFQPGCILDLTGTCSHFLAYFYVAEAIRNGGFPSQPCPTYKDAIWNNCAKNCSETVRMGDPENAETAEGVFYVPVRAFPPFRRSC